MRNITTESVKVPWKVMHTAISSPWVMRLSLPSTNYIPAMEYGGALTCNNVLDINSFPLLPTARPFNGWSQSVLTTEKNFSALQGLVVFRPETST